MYLGNLNYIDVAKIRHRQQGDDLNVRPINWNYVKFFYGTEYSKCDNKRYAIMRIYKNIENNHLSVGIWLSIIYN